MTGKRCCIAHRRLFTKITGPEDAANHLMWSLSADLMGRQIDRHGATGCRSNATDRGKRETGIHVPEMWSTRVVCPSGAQMNILSRGISMLANISHAGYKSCSCLSLNGCRGSADVNGPDLKSWIWNLIDDNWGGRVWPQFQRFWDWSVDVIGWSEPSADKQLLSIISTKRHNEQVI